MFSVRSISNTTLYRGTMYCEILKNISVEADMNHWLIVSPPLENGTYTEVNFQ